MAIALLVFALLICCAYFIGKAVGRGAFGTTRTISDILDWLEHK